MTRLTKEGAVLVGIAVVIVAVLPLLNMLRPDSMFYLPDFYLNLLGKYLSLAILAMGLDLLWGYAGILSLCQAVFFGFGGYCLGMHLMLEIGPEQSKYGEALPDFMVWNQVTELPLFWKPFYSFWFAIVAVILVPTLFAIVFGSLTFRSRIRGVYVSILTQALAFSAWLMFNRNEMNLGGTNGLTDFKTMLGFSLLDPSTQRGLYIVTALCLVASYVLCRWITMSKLGKVLRAVRDNENRLHFSGFSTTGFKVFAFAVSGFLGGLAGALYVPQVGIITPSQIGVLPSLEVVVGVALGGRGTLIGGPLGAIVVNALRTILTSRFPELWPFILGGLFVGAVLLFPTGLVGLPGQLTRLVQRTRVQLVKTPAAFIRDTVASPNPGHKEQAGLRVGGEPIQEDGTSANGQSRPVMEAVYGLAAGGATAPHGPPRVEEPILGFAERGSGGGGIGGRVARRRRSAELTSAAESVRRPEPTAPHGPPRVKETILYLEGVTVSFEGFLALRNLNFYMDKGELRFVIGPNGAGKTTLLDVVCGSVKPITGRVIFEEATDLLPLSVHQIANKGIGRKFQTPAVFPHHSVYDNMVLSVRASKRIAPTLFARNGREDHERILYLLEYMGLVEQADHPAGALSHGQKQWLEIGMLMVQDPKLLLLDEPVAGMTGKEREETGLLLEAIARDHSVLVIEHDMEFVRHLARTVTVLHEGSVLCEGTMDKVQNDPRVIEVYLGREQEARA